jgi:predicted dehydrogenase
VGRLHADAALASPGVRVSAVCDLVPDTAEKVASGHRAEVFTDHRDLIASGLVDAVVVNTPHALHTGIVVDAAAAGLHVLVEKPMATTVEDCETMERACEEAGVVLFVGHIQHFLPPMLAAKAALDAGLIGPLLMVDDRRGTDYRPGARPAWFFNPALSGGGAFINIGAHCVDRLLWLTGRRAVAVSATAAHREAHPVETDALARIELDRGVVGHISVTSAGLPSHDELVLVAERGAIKVSRTSGAVLHHYSGPQAGVPVTLAPASVDDVPQAFRHQLTAFGAAIRGEQAPAVPAAHGRHVVEVLRAAYRSFEGGGCVRLDAALAAAEPEGGWGES